MLLAAAIIAVIALAAVVVLTTAQARDHATATGALSRATVRRDRAHAIPAGFAAVARPATTGRDIERAVENARHHRAVVVEPSTAPAPRVPPDEEAIGVTRRQFLNRGIVNLFALGLGAFGASTLAFLWPTGSGGFGSKFDLPMGLREILSYYATNKQPYYYAPGRLYVSPYPRSALTKASKVYTGSVVEGMKHGVVALYQKCPHLGCRVPWCTPSQWFECPCHGSQYNRVGEKKGGPAPRGMDRFPVVIDGDRVQVDTGLVILGPPIGTNTTGQEAEGPHCVSGRSE